MLINNKEFHDWMAEDLQVILGNDEYRESDFVDYKEDFAFLRCGKEEKARKIAEFCNDICSFANADGGYMFFGIIEGTGTPVEIEAISIIDTDRFELDLRNNVQRILPVVPHVDFRFIMVSEGNYVVAAKIEKGYNKPYTYNDKNSEYYKFFVRRGNGKRPMTYSEIRDDYLHSKSLSNEITNFRRQRVEDYSIRYPDLPFALLHIIPANFFEGNTGEHLYDEFKREYPPYTTYFDGLTYGSIIPNVDGICFPGDYLDTDPRVKNLLQLFNNGVSEFFLSLNYRTDGGREEVVALDDILKRLEILANGTNKIYKFRNKNSSAFICVSIIGCMGMWNNKTAMFRRKVDRNRIDVMPVEVQNIAEDEQVKEVVEHCKMIIKYSVGIGR